MLHELAQNFYFFGKNMPTKLFQKQIRLNTSSSRALIDLIRKGKRHFELNKKTTNTKFAVTYASYNNLLVLYLYFLLLIATFCKQFRFNYSCLENIGTQPYSRA